jgi:CyaY protein
MSLTSDTMDEKTFKDLSHTVIERVRSALDQQDPDVVEANLEADVLKIVFPSGLPFVLNMQRPVREMWLAADRRAWHFRYDGAKWLCPKTGDELFSRLSELVSTRIGEPIEL